MNTTCKSSGGNPSRAFTLLELLVVVAVIGLLIAILVPSLSRAREQTKTAKCLSNLSQLGKAAALYVSDFDNSFPLSSDDKGNEWDLAPVSTPTSTVRAGGILYRLPAPGDMNLTIFMCPSYVIASNPTALFTGYNYNRSFIGRGYGEYLPDRSKTVPPAKDFQLAHPATTALFGDGQHATSSPNKHMRAPAMANPAVDGGDYVDEATRAAGTQGFRHSGKTNVAWADSHAEGWGQRADKTSPSGKPTGLKTGFLSPDNSLYSLK